MERYTVISTNRPRGFHIKDDSGHVLTDMRQRSWYSQDMEGHVEGHEVRIVSEGFWRSRYGVLVSGARIGTITTKAWGQLGVGLTFPGKMPVDLEIAAVGAWSSLYQLRLAKGLPLLEVKPAFRWSTFTTDLHVTVKGPGIATEQMPLLLAITGFCVRLKRARSAAHAGAGA